MVGSAIIRKLHKEGYKNLVLKTHQELELMNPSIFYRGTFFERAEDIFILNK